MIPTNKDVYDYMIMKRREDYSQGFKEGFEYARKIMIERIRNIEPYFLTTRTSETRYDENYI